MENYWDFYWILQFLFYIREDSIPEKEMRSWRHRLCCKGMCETHSQGVCHLAFLKNDVVTVYNFFEERYSGTLQKEKTSRFEPMAGWPMEKRLYSFFQCFEHEICLFKRIRMTVVQTPSTADPEITACPCPTHDQAAAAGLLLLCLGSRERNSSPGSRERAAENLSAGGWAQHTLFLYMYFPAPRCTTPLSAAGRLSQGVSYLRSPRGWDVTR